MEKKKRNDKIKTHVNLFFQKEQNSKENLVLNKISGSI